MAKLEEKIYENFSKQVSELILDWDGVTDILPKAIDLQEEIKLYLEDNHVKEYLVRDNMDVYEIRPLHYGSVFVSPQMRAFLAQKCGAYLDSIYEDILDGKDVC